MRPFSAYRKNPVKSYCQGQRNVRLELLVVSILRRERVALKVVGYSVDGPVLRLKRAFEVDVDQDMNDVSVGAALRVSVFQSLILVTSYTGESFPLPFNLARSYLLCFRKTLNAVPNAMIFIATLPSPSLHPLLTPLSCSLSLKSPLYHLHSSSGSRYCPRSFYVPSSGRCRYSAHFIPTERRQVH